MRGSECIRGLVVAALLGLAGDAIARVVVVPDSVREDWSRRAVGTEGPALDAARRVYGVWRDGGWLWARVQVEGDTLRVDPGPRARVGEVELGGAEPELLDRFRRALDLPPGADWRPERWEERAQAAVLRLGELGYPFARVDVRTIQADSTRARVDLSLWLSEGPQAVVTSVVVEGATHTRPDVLARLSGVRLGRPYRESDRERIRARLLAREVVDEVTAVTPAVAPGGTDAVQLRIGVVQPRTLGRIAAAVGVVQDREADETRVSGRVDLALLDLFGSARQFRVNWLDDGRQRRTLDLNYLEPILFGTPLDLELHLGQRHEDERFDTVVIDSDLRIPWEGDRRLQLGVGLDRTTFVGEGANVRTRRRARAALSLGRRRSETRGLFGRFTTVLEAARVAQTTRVEDEENSQETGGQTILDTRVELGLVLRPGLAAVVRATWQRVDDDRLPLPPSEQWRVGGATTVRGYEEQRFAGEEVAFGGGELRFGRARRAQAYAFVDTGWVRETRRVDERLEVRETWLNSFGLGLRAPVAVGDLDVSLGFPGTLGFEEGKLHVALDQRF